MKLSRLPHQCPKLVTLTFYILREIVIRRLLLTFGIGTSIGVVHFKSNLYLKKVILRLKMNRLCYSETRVTASAFRSYCQEGKTEPFAFFKKMAVSDWWRTDPGWVAKARTRSCKTMWVLSNQWFNSPAQLLCLTCGNENVGLPMMRWPDGSLFRARPAQRTHHLQLEMCSNWCIGQRRKMVLTIVIEAAQQCILMSAHQPALQNSFHNCHWISTTAQLLKNFLGPLMCGTGCTKRGAVFNFRWGGFCCLFWCEAAQKGISHS